MGTAETTETVPASRIMRERGQYKEAWALELTRSEQLVRELAKTREALEAARKTCDDLTNHCTRQGGYIANLQSQVLGLSHDCADLREQLIVALAGPSGKDCDECGGTGYVEDELMCGDPGADLGYRITEVVDQCDACFGHGRVQS